MPRLAEDPRENQVQNSPSGKSVRSMDSTTVMPSENDSETESMVTVVPRVNRISLGGSGKLPGVNRIGPEGPEGLIKNDENFPPLQNTHKPKKSKKMPKWDFEPEVEQGDQDFQFRLAKNVLVGPGEAVWAPIKFARKEGRPDWEKILAFQPTQRISMWLETTQVTPKLSKDLTRLGYGGPGILLYNHSNVLFQGQHGQRVGTITVRGGPRRTPTRPTC